MRIFQQIVPIHIPYYQFTWLYSKLLRNLIIYVYRTWVSLYEVVWPYMNNSHELSGKYESQCKEINWYIDNLICEMVAFSFLIHLFLKLAI